MPRLDDAGELASYAVAIAGGLAMWGVGLRAFRRMRRGGEAATRDLGTIARIQPLFWVAGAAIGAFTGFAVIDSAVANRASLAASYCRDIFEPGDPRAEHCVEDVMDCRDEARRGPCGEIGARAQADRCVEAHRERVAALTDEQAALLPPVDGEYLDSMRSICVIEHL